MDLGDIAALAVAIILGAIASWAKGQKKNGEASKDSHAVPSRPHVRTQAPPITVQPPKTGTVPPVREPEAAPSPRFEPAETPLRKETPAQSSGLKPLSGDRLRDAIIWSEILQRKF